MPLGRPSDRKGNVTRSLAPTNEKHADGWPLVCRIRQKEEEEPCVDISDALGKNILHTFAITPPMSRIIIRIWNRNDADGDIMAESFLKEKASTPSVNIF